MTPLGWTFMIASCGSVIVLTAWCFWKVLSHAPESTDLHAPSVIDTGDEGT